MKQDWINFLAQKGARREGYDFGNQAEELLSAQSATVITPLTDLSLIRASGEDATIFLHNMLTNDINGLSSDGVQRNGLCNPKGRLLATLLLWREGPDLMIAVPADLQAVILKKLSMYVLRSKVKLTDASDERVLLGLSGPQFETAVNRLAPVPPIPLRSLRIEHGGLLIRLDERRILLALDTSEAPAIWQELTGTARPVGFSAWNWLEIVAGIPSITALTYEEFIPQMVNFDLIGGVSFHKGCYPGQEIVARTKYLGKIKRRMYRAHIEGNALTINAGDHLYAPETGEQPCGQVVNAAPSPLGGSDLLAVIQSTCADTGEVYLGNPSGPHLALLPLPYPQEDQQAAEKATPHGEPGV
ncbi:MAG: folate-binding protein YgfZ [Sterolibacterium sp.]|nr:folate-binding protein YgfZ [Sterolibacterium sp.]